MTALEPAGGASTAPANDFRCGHADCRQPLRKCHNYEVENVCNRCYVPDAGMASNGDDTEAGHGDVPPARLCAACQRTVTIPDLSVAGNREKWARLETAKRRLLYTLDRLGLPHADTEPQLTFEFKADDERLAGEWRSAGPSEVVYTGHAGGNITINIREADDAIREQLRCQFQEAHRTLVGHFHHEIGHYYWEVLVQNRQENKFRRLFGDHNDPAYQEALNAYHQSGPRQSWSESFISAYASSHPWEDFAETFALYLDMISILDTAAHLFRSMRINFRSRSVKALVERFQEIGILVNEFNRTVGLMDLVPDVVVSPVVEKLEFIHALVRGARRSSPIKPMPASQSISAPVRM
jgi:hypothetical protein